MKTVIEMAQEAGLRSAVLLRLYGKTEALCESELEELEQIKKFAELVRADEREACAKLCDDKHDTWRFGDGEDSTSGPKDCAAAIRARGNT